MENTATARQRWALFCITKKDYRNVILSKEKASQMIQELSNRTKTSSTKTPVKSLKSELLSYLMSKIDVFYNALVKEMGYKSVLTDDTHIPKNKRKSYIMIGFGCGITYLTYRKGNKKAEEIKNYADYFRSHEILQALTKKFPKKDIQYLEKIGNPLGAIWLQMQNLQCVYYDEVLKFASSKGIKMDYYTNLD